MRLGSFGRLVAKRLNLLGEGVQVLDRGVGDQLRDEPGLALNHVEELLVALHSVEVGRVRGVHDSPLDAGPVHRLKEAFGGVHDDTPIVASAEGLPIVPPIVTVTNWQILIPFYVVLIAVVTGALIVSRRPGVERRKQTADG